MNIQFYLGFKSHLIYIYIDILLNFYTYIDSIFEFRDKDNNKCINAL